MKLKGLLIVSLVAPVVIVLLLLYTGVFYGKSEAFYRIGTLVSLIIGLGASYWLLNFYRKSSKLQETIQPGEQDTIC